MRRDVRAVLRRLPEREQQILLLRFYGERTQSEIAERLGISQVHVSRVLTRTLSAVRDHVLYDVPLPTTGNRRETTIPAPRRARDPCPRHGGNAGSVVDRPSPPRGWAAPRLPLTGGERAAGDGTAPGARSPDRPQGPRTDPPGWILVRHCGTVP